MKNKSYLRNTVMLSALLFSSAICMPSIAKDDISTDQVLLAKNQIPNDIIIPGVSLSNVVLGQPIPESFIKKMGPYRQDEYGHPDNFVWPQKGQAEDWDLLIKTKYLNGKKVVTAIYTNSKQFKTSKGIRVGSSLAAVQKAYPLGGFDECMDGDCWVTNNIIFTSYDNKKTVGEMSMVWSECVSGILEGQC